MITALVMLAVLRADAPASTHYPQDPEYLIEGWDSSDGMPESSATAMVQTGDGYLWFGTWDGLVRFNGVDFKTLSSSDTPGLVGGGVVNLFYDDLDRLWVNTVGGLSVREGQQWRRMAEADGWNLDMVRTISERPGGELLFTGFDGRLLEFSGGNFHPLPNPGDRGRGSFGYADRDGRWWVVQKAFVGRWEEGGWKRLLPPKELPPSAVAASKARDGGMWLLEGEVLRKFCDGAEVQRLVIPDAPGDYWGLSEDRAGRVWIATGQSGLIRVSADGNVRRWTTANGLSSDSLRFATEDREGNVWVGTNGGGLQRFTPRRFRTIVMPGAAGPSKLTTISPRRKEEYGWDPTDTGLAVLMPGIRWPLPGGPRRFPR